MTRNGWHVAAGNGRGGDRGCVVTVAVGEVPLPPPPRHHRRTTATVVRTDLATTVLTGGTLGYVPTDPFVNQLAGTYTQIPTMVGRRRRSVLYRVDNHPVVLLTGSTPAWRAFTAGMTDGPDVERAAGEPDPVGLRPGAVLKDQQADGHGDG